MLVGYICVTPNAYLDFHWATTAFHMQELWNAYPPDIRQWISQHGGLTNQMIWLHPLQIYRYFREWMSVRQRAGIATTFSSSALDVGTR